MCLENRAFPETVELRIGGATELTCSGVCLGIMLLCISREKGTIQGDAEEAKSSRT